MNLFCQPIEILMEFIMIFLDSLSSACFEETPESSVKVVKNYALKPYEFLNSMVMTPSYSRSPFDPEIRDEDVDAMIDLFKEKLQGDVVSIRAKITETLNEAPQTDNAFSIFNNFKDLNKSYTKFFVRVDHIRLNRYV